MDDGWCLKLREVICTNKMMDGDLLFIIMVYFKQGILKYFVQNYTFLSPYKKCSPTIMSYIFVIE